MATASDILSGRTTSIDKWLLRAGFFALILSVISIFFVPLGFCLILPALFLRQRAKKCIALWQLMQTHPEVSLSEYMQQTGNSLSDVKRAVKKINKAGVGLVAIDSSKNRIYDSRLKESDSVNFHCKNCGAIATVSSVSSAPRDCQYCEAPVPDDAFEALEKTRESLVQVNYQRIDSYTRMVVEEKRDRRKEALSYLLFCLIIAGLNCQGTTSKTARVEKLRTAPIAVSQQQAAETSEATITEAMRRRLSKIPTVAEMPKPSSIKKVTKINKISTAVEKSESGCGISLANCY